MTEVPLQELGVQQETVISWWTQDQGLGSRIADHGPDYRPRNNLIPL